MELSIFWFRRDLRLEDNTALHYALRSGNPVLPVFIFDKAILNELVVDDARLTFIFQSLQKINLQLREYGSSLLSLHGNPDEIFSDLIKEHPVKNLYYNKDYEPYGIDRDRRITNLFKRNGIEVMAYKDHVIFEEDEVMKDDGKPYTVYTPYKNKWLSKFNKKDNLPLMGNEYKNLFIGNFPFPSIESIGFKSSKIKVLDYNLTHLAEYADARDFPARNATSYLSPHLRFGTISIRQAINQLKDADSVFLNELIWREFFMQILFHFPKVVSHNFRAKYDTIRWRNNEEEFQLWCKGKTGYPFVDAGMRELNTTGYMHNRVRMIVAGFLCKHLLIDWRWGEAYFAQKLLDYELSSNNGNWQWAAGTGCDAAPYFRVFNPATQLQKFDKDLIYIKKWIPEYNTPVYPLPLVDHSFARNRALEVYKSAIEH